MNGFSLTWHPFHAISKDIESFENKTWWTLKGRTLQNGEEKKTPDKDSHQKVLGNKWMKCSHEKKWKKWP